MRVTPSLLPALVGLACADPCPPVPVQLPAEPVALPWVDRATSEVGAEGRPLALLFDTGFSRTTLSAEAAAGMDLGAVELSFGGVSAGPLSAGLWLDAPVSGVVGSDVLHQLPLELDARARETRVLPRYSQPSSPIPLLLADSGQCAGEAGRRAPLLAVEGRVDGTAVTFVLDTGAELSFVRSDVFEALSGRARLEGLRVASGFAGVFIASATRARGLELGEARASAVVVLSSPEVDRELGRLSTPPERSAGGLSRPHPTFAGFLGWNFLREHSVSLAEGLSSLDDRRLGLARFDAQDHWQRELVGIGVLTSPSESPPGLRIDGFLSVSPAREAGLGVGDVIVTVNGVAAQQAPTPYAQAGTTIRLQVSRGTGPLAVEVEVRDLLPDP